MPMKSHKSLGGGKPQEKMQTDNNGDNNSH